jgi:hypothetical protein
MLGGRNPCLLLFCSESTSRCPDPEPFLIFFHPSTTRYVLVSCFYTTPEFILFFCEFWCLRETFPDLPETPRFLNAWWAPQRMVGASPPTHFLRHARSPTLTLITRDGGGGGSARLQFLHRRLVGHSAPHSPITRDGGDEAAQLPNQFSTASAEPHPHTHHP